MKEEDFDNLIYLAFARAEKQKVNKGDQQNGGQDCLSEETISCFVESLLSDAEREKAERHIFDCPFCLETVIDVVKSEELEKAEMSKGQEKTGSKAKAKKGLGEVMDAVTNPLKISLAWVGEHLTLKETNAEFIPFWNKLKPVIVRGGSDKKGLSVPPFSKTYEDYKVKVRVIEEEKGQCALQLKIFLLAEKKKGARIKAELIKEGRLYRSILFEDETLLFQGIPSGEYIIHVWGGERLIADIAIKIKP